MAKGKSTPKTFAEKLEEINKNMEEIAGWRKEAADLTAKAKNQETTLSSKQFKVLSSELKLRGIDCSDLQFIVDACVFYKQYKAENEPSLLDAEGDALSGMDDASELKSNSVVDENG